MLLRSNRIESKWCGGGDSEEAKVLIPVSHYIAPIGEENRSLLLVVPRGIRAVFSPICAVEIFTMAIMLSTNEAHLLSREAGL